LAGECWGADAPLVPCGRCERTCGAAPAAGGAGFGVGAGSTVIVGTVSVVCVGVLGVVVSGGGLAALAVPEAPAPASAAPLTDGRASPSETASSAMSANRERRWGVIVLIASLSCRGGS
jgi:hypothetical protein